MTEDIKTKKASGSDRTDGSFVKMMYNINSNAMLNLYNSTWNSGDYPDVWKVAKVTLIPREGKDPKNQDSYRPILLLPIWGKIYDKTVTRKLTSYLESN